MGSLNRVTLIGRLGADPEIKATPSGAMVCNFSVATSESWKDKASGEKKEKTEWHRVQAWRELAEVCGKYLAKGREVCVEGKLQTRTYEKEGVKHYSTEVVADRVVFLGSGKSDGAREEDHQPSQRGQRAPEGNPPPPGSDDDIPF